MDTGRSISFTSSGKGTSNCSNILCTYIDLLDVSLGLHPAFQGGIGWYGVATTATEEPASTQEGSEVNGFPENVLLATDGLENTALAVRAAVDLAKKGDAKKSTSERRNNEAFAP
jgi:hypothetical protein